jgi:hypothetical protein
MRSQKLATIVALRVLQKHPRNLNGKGCDVGGRILTSVADWAKKGSPPRYQHLFFRAQRHACTCSPCCMQNTHERSEQLVAVTGSWGTMQVRPPWEEQDGEPLLARTLAEQAVQVLETGDPRDKARLTHLCFRQLCSSPPELGTATAPERASPPQVPRSFPQSCAA